MSAPQWRFADFRLDPDNACLWRETQPIALTPKAFDVLYYLVTHPDRLVTKEALLDAVWPETAVTDVVVRIAIRELRRALGDTVQTPRFIATIPRRGYRFLASVTAVSVAENVIDLPASHAAYVPTSLPPLIGRESALQRLAEAWLQARQGHRQVVWVTGEAGIGKTAVTETFRAQTAIDSTVWIAVGQCVEYYGLGEAYLPILEALGQLCRGSGGERLVALLRQHAPTWLIQIPWLLTLTHRERLSNELRDVTRERMLREFADVIDALTAETPLVLIFEDLHWSDYATLDLLALLARRRTPARLFVIGTYRPVEAIMHHRPLRRVVQDLRRHGHAIELSLALLSVESVTAYLEARFPVQQLPSALAPWLYQRTDGNPLFLVTLVQALVERGVVLEHNGCWTVHKNIVPQDLEVPEGLHQLIEEQVARLSPDTQRVLEVASVAGVVFADVTVAVGLKADIASVEEHCEVLVAQQWLRPLEVAIWPDGTVAMHYTFVHALYQQVLYEQLGAGRRVRLHQELGECLEAAYGSRVNEIAAELAEHFGHSQDVRRAVPYLQQAAENALRRCGNQEAIHLLTKALALLTTLPDSLERCQQELILQNTLGPALIATRGYAASDVAQTYARACELCRRLGDSLSLFVALRSLQLFHVVRAELQRASELAEELLFLAQRQHDPVHLVFAHLALGIVLFHRGAFVQAQLHLEQAMALEHFTPEQTYITLYGNDAVVVCLAWMALTLWLLGYPDQAQQRGQEALIRAQQLAQPFSLALALDWSAWLHQMCCEPQATQDKAEAAIAVCTEQGFVQLLAFGGLLRGWALVAQQQGEDGLVHIQQGLAAYQGTGAAIGRPQYLSLLAEAYGQIGQPEAGLTLLTEAVVVVGQTGEQSYEAELHRLTGQLLLARSEPFHMEAEASLHRALTVARHQQAKSLELRAATSLSRLWQEQGKQTKARQLLGEIYGWFTEGFDTANLQEAKALLRELA